MKNPALLTIIHIFSNEDAEYERLVNILHLTSDKYLKVELVIINNGEELKLCKQLIEKLENIVELIQFVDLSKKYRYDIAVLAGYEASLGDYILEYDPSYLVDTDDFCKIYDSINNGRDIVSLIDQNVGVLERIFNNILFRFTGTQHTYDSEIIRIISRRSLNRSLQNKSSFSFIKKLIIDSGFVVYKIIAEKSKKVTKLHMKSFINKSIYILILNTNMTLIFGKIFTLSIPALIIANIICSMVYEYSEPLANASILTLLSETVFMLSIVLFKQKVILDQFATKYIYNYRNHEIIKTKNKHQIQEINR